MSKKLITEEIADRLRNTEPLTLNISRIMKRSVMRNFETESDGKRRWQRLAHSTLKQRAKKGYTGKTLQRTGQLKRSVFTEHGNDYALVGTNLAYAAAQNYGAVMHRSSLRAYMRRKKKGKKAKYSGKNKMNSWRLPARPFLVLRENYEKQIKSEIQDWIRGK